MPATIKLEKVVDENPDNDFPDLDCVSIDSYNNLQCQNENLQLLLSISKETCSDQESKLLDLKFQIDEMQTAISNLEEQVLVLKQEKVKSSVIISEKDKIIDIMYDKVGNLDSRNNYSVSDPKSAMMKLNDYEETMKELRNQVINNKILIMAMCKILGCVDSKIIQSLKDVISENEVHKEKYKIYEQFYKNSQKAMDEIALELHRNGYDDKLFIDNNSLQKPCAIHRESLDNWNEKMSNLRRYHSAGNIENSSGKSPTAKQENYSQQKTNFSCIPTDFYRQVPPPPPPQLGLPGLCGMDVGCGVGGCAVGGGRLAADAWCTQGRSNRASRYNASNGNGSNGNGNGSGSARASGGSSNPISEPHSSTHDNTASAFEINANVFDWKNCASAEGKQLQLQIAQDKIEIRALKAQVWMLEAQRNQEIVAQIHPPAQQDKPKRKRLGRNTRERLKKLRLAEHDLLAKQEITQL